MITSKMSPQNLILRQCNLCGEQKAIRFLYYKAHYAIVQCQSCSLIYTNEIPSRAELNTIYSSDFFTVGAKFTDSPTGGGHGNAEQRVKQLLTLADIGLDKWLDVGCATGNFILAAKPFVTEIYGIEISDYAVSQAKRRGLSNLVVGDFLEVELRKDQFDMVSMWDVIEHVTDPMANLRKAFQILKPGGCLALSTGDIDSKIARLTGRFWHLMIPPRHLYFFSRSTIELMLAANDFSSVSIQYPGKRVPLDFMLWKLTNLFVPRASSKVVGITTLLRLGKIAPVINLGDIMTIYARKPLA